MDTFIEKIKKQGCVEIPLNVSYNITFNQSFYPKMPTVTYSDCDNKIYLRGDEIGIEGFYLSAVIWMPGYISLYHTTKCQDFISFDFDGCVMASFDIGNEHYAAHIQRGAPDCTEEWIDFLTKNRKSIKNLVMFRPDFEKMRSVRNSLTEPNSAWLWGLITPNRTCYSICVSGEENSLGGYSTKNKFSLEFIEIHQTPFQIDAYNSIIQPTGDPKVAWDSFFKAMSVREIHTTPFVDINAPRSQNRQGFSCC